MEIECEQCGLVHNKKPSVIARAKNHYCSQECSQLARRKRIKCECGVCGNKFERTEAAASKYDNVFCSKSCAATASNTNKRRNWKGGFRTYRIRAMKELPNLCNRCGYNTIVKILQVHHIDKDRDNNEISNLEILCPNCHCEEHYC